MAVKLSDDKENFDCQKCSAEDKELLGCETESAEPIGYAGYEFPRCPRKCIPPRILHIVQLASMVEAGLLPDAGGVLDQSAAFIDAACIVTAVRAETRAEKAERESHGRRNRKRNC